MGLFINELKRFYWESRTYYPDFIVSIFVSFLIYLLFIGFNRNIQDEYMSYFFWVLASNVISEASVSISSEKQMGTLKNLMLKPYSIMAIMTCRTAAWFIVNLVKVILIICLIKVILPIRIVLNPLILLTLVITMIGIYGFSMVLMALTIVYTKTASFETIIGYVLLLFSGLIFPLDRLPNYLQAIARFSPLYLGIDISSSIFNNSFRVDSLYLLSVQSLVYLAAGYMIFKAILKRSLDFSMDY